MNNEDMYGVDDSLEKEAYFYFTITDFQNLFKQFDTYFIMKNLSDEIYLQIEEYVKDVSSGRCNRP